MSFEMILDYPLLDEEGGNFLEGVGYEVIGTQLANSRSMIIEHRLRGQSYIRELLISGKARFVTSYLFKNTGERFSVQSTPDELDISSEELLISSEQTIDFDYSYAPQVSPSIVLLEDEYLDLSSESGLVSLWNINESIKIEKFSRLATHPKLNFSSGDAQYLIYPECDDRLENGTLEVRVRETAGEHEKPISMLCSQDIYDELSARPPKEQAQTSGDGMRSAIVTQVLTAVYSYMSNLQDKDTDIHSGLLTHMNSLEDDWTSDNFNPALAASKAYPYIIEVLNNDYE